METPQSIASTPNLPLGATQTRPASPKVFGILSIIFASLMLLMSMGGTLGLMASNVIDHAQPILVREGIPSDVSRAVISSFSSFYTITGIQSLIIMIFSGLLLAAGIGQLGYRRWARKFTVVWGIAALAILLIFVLFNILIAGPALASAAQAIDAYKPSHFDIDELMGAAGTMVGGAMSMMLVVFLSPYPILLLAFFTKARVREAMKS